MSEIQTDRWVNKSEEEVVSKLGDFKRKEKVELGYKLFYDFSTYRVPKNIQSSYIGSVQNSNIVDKQGRLMVSRTDVPASPNRASTLGPLFEVANLKTLEFFFDANKKVNYVFASGYPDSIRYELRKK